MLPTMKRRPKPKIAIVGAGNLGSALAVSLRAAGYTISKIFSRDTEDSLRRARRVARRVGARAAVLGKDACAADLLWLCVPDREIRNCAERLAGSGAGLCQVALHASGALPSDELAALSRRGVSVAAVHPLMTFVPGEIPALARVPFAIEGDSEASRMAKRVVRDLGGEAFLLKKKDKAAYHAWGALASPLFTSLLVTAEQVAAGAGIARPAARKMMLPILEQTLANYAKHGPARAFSGPIIRGDADTLAKHLKVLRRIPAAREVYLALARAAVRNLPAKNKAQLLKTLV
jgi:predicted short-subunit dehydrogenase-like oxidoreductase (DUF2520 family)